MSIDDQNEGDSGRNAPLEMSPGEFRRLGHGLVDAISAWMESLPERPVNRDESPSEVRKLLPDGGLPDEGRDPESLLDEAVSLLADHRSYSDSTHSSARAARYQSATSACSRIAEA
jgi:hypothetical protein